MITQVILKPKANIDTFLLNQGYKESENATALLAIYEDYLKYCEEQDREPIRKRDFAKTLDKKFPFTTKRNYKYYYIVKGK